MKNVLDQAYQRVFDLKESSDRVPEVRASSMPICPKKFILGCLDYINGNSSWDYRGDFYCNIGTTIHSALQKWIPQAIPGQILGNWECWKCSTVNPKTNKRIPLIVSGKVGPLACPNCGQPMEYREFTLRFKGCPMTGHCDGIVLDKGFLVNTLKIAYDENFVRRVNGFLYSNSTVKVPAYILEYKSTGMWKCKKVNTPDHSHKCQATVYKSCGNDCLPLDYGIHTVDLKGFIIKYFSRENPEFRSRDFLVEVDNDSLYKATIKIVNLIFAALKDPSVTNIKRTYNCWCCRKLPKVYGDCDLLEVCADYNFKDYCNDWNKVVDKLGKHFALRGISLF